MVGPAASDIAVAAVAGVYGLPTVLGHPALDFLRWVWKWAKVDHDELGLAFATAKADDQQAVIYRVFGRYAGAAEDRPLKIRFSVPVDVADDAAADWLDFVHWGKPTGFVPVKDLRLDPPRRVRTRYRHRHRAGRPKSKQSRH